MSRKELEALNKNLIYHLKEVGINNAFYYEPVNPEWYWTNNRKKIALCNLETYNTNGDSDYKGIHKVDEDYLHGWADGNKTISNTFFLNYCIQLSMEQTFFKQTSDSLKKLRQEAIYDDLHEKMDLSLYFNFRYSISDIVNASNGYIYGCYINDLFYSKHYKEFVKAAEIDVLIISGRVGADLIQIIYPELKGKFIFRGNPVFHNGILFISIPHLSRISYANMAKCINSISDFLQN